MKFIRLSLSMGLMLYINANAATFSGYVFCDTNQNGIKDTNETCTQESVWIKMIEDEKWVSVQGPLFNDDPTLSGHYEFNTNRTDIPIRIIIDNNADSKDTSATPPPNISITVDPDSPLTDPLTADGEASYTITPAGTIDNTGLTSLSNQNYGMIFGGDCICADADGNVTKQTITIDGDVSEWSTVYSDPDNNICDYGCSLDKDAPVQSTGRNLVQFAWTGDNLYAYGYTYRVGSSSNTQTFLYYADRDGDGLIGDGGDIYDANGAVIGYGPDFAIEAGWQGTNGTVSLTFYPYIPANPAGDPMVWTQAEIDAGKIAPGGQIPDSSWVGSGDGYTLNGHLDTTNAISITGANGSAQGVTVATGGIDDAGVKMEWRLRWAFLGLKPFQRITYHVSAMNASVNSTNPPGQVDENMAGCYGEATIEYCGVELVPNRAIVLSATEAASTSYVYFSHTLTNTGNAAESVALNLYQTNQGDPNAFIPTSIRYFNDINGNGVIEGGEPELTGGNGDLGLGESMNLLVQIGLPGSLVDAVAIGEINASTTSCAINKSAVVYDSITVLDRNYDLSISKEVSDADETWADTVTTDEGDPASYRITVTNNGPDDAPAVTVNDVLPAGVTYVSYSATAGTYSAGQWIVGPIANGNSETLTINVTVKEGVGSIGGTTIQNIASTTDANNTDANDWDDANITAIHIPEVNLQVSKVVSDPTVYETEDINYTITVTNFGPDTATNVNVHDVLPPEVTYTDIHSLSTGTFDGTDWFIDTMAPGAVETLTIQVNVNSGATLTSPIINQACVSTDTIDTNAADDCSEAMFIATNEVDTGVIKTVNIPAPNENDTIIYTINVTNYGPIAVTNLQIEDDPITWGNVQSVVPSAGSYLSPTWTIPNLDVNQTETLTITAIVNAGTTGLSFTNTATIVGLDQNDTNGVNDSSSATITVGCPCDDVHSDSSPSMNKTTAALMILITIFTGLFFIRREEQINQNKR